jgi:hypothetical protein
MSKYRHSPRKYSFGKQLRIINKSSKNKIPGPGSYNHSSEFGLYNMPPRMISRMLHNKVNISNKV